MLQEVSTQTLAQAPKSLSQFTQRPIPYGLYQGAIADVTTEPWSGLRRSQRKAWMYAGAFSERYYVGFAIADAGLASTAFAYVFDSQTSMFVEEKTMVPFGFSGSFDGGLTNDWKLKNYTFTPNGNNLVFAYEGKRLKLKMTLVEDGKGSTTVAPAADRPFHHTYKNLQMPAQVELTLDGEAISFDGNIGSVDFSKGYPPKHTFWNWASLNAVTESGIPFGVNLVGDFNNGIENALWVDGTVVQLAQSTFSYSRPVEKNTWHVKTLDGVIDMQFKPLGFRGEDINALIMLSRFKQPFGVFTGTIQLNGQAHKFTGYGVVEEHFAKW